MPGHVLVSLSSLWTPDVIAVMWSMLWKIDEPRCGAGTPENTELGRPFSYRSLPVRRARNTLEDTGLGSGSAGDLVAGPVTGGKTAGATRRPFSFQFLARPAGREHSCLPRRHSCRRAFSWLRWRGRGSLSGGRNSPCRTGPRPGPGRRKRLSHLVPVSLQN